MFATNDLGVKVWEASYTPFGGVHTSTGGTNLRFPFGGETIHRAVSFPPHKWFQSEHGLHQNWMPECCAGGRSAERSGHCFSTPFVDNIPRTRS